MTLFNQFSGVLFYLAAGVTLMIAILWRLPAAKRRVGTLIGIGGLLFGGLLIFQPAPAGVTAVTAQQTIAANGNPVLLELYSDY